MDLDNTKVCKHKKKIQYLKVETLLIKKSSRRCRDCCKGIVSLVVLTDILVCCN